MSRILGVCLVVLCLGTVPGPIEAQEMDFGTLYPVDPEARDIAGIVSFHLVREEGLVIDGKGGKARVTALGLDGDTLAECSIVWQPDGEPPRRNLRMTCALSAPEKNLEISYRGGVEAELRDLDTGENLVLWREESQRDSTQRRIYTREEAEGIRHQKQGRGWVIESSKTEREAEESWGRETTLMRYLLAEVELIFQRPNKHRPARFYEGDKLLPCQNMFCNGNALVAGQGRFELTMNACCIEASEDADIGCKLHTGLGCCGNTLCTGGCFILLCDCDLFGLLWECDPCI